MSFSRSNGRIFRQVSIRLQKPKAGQHASRLEKIRSDLAWRPVYPLRRHSVRLYQKLTPLRAPLASASLSPLAHFPRWHPQRHLPAMEVQATLLCQLWPLVEDPAMPLGRFRRVMEDQAMPLGRLWLVIEVRAAPLGRHPRGGSPEPHLACPLWLA